MAARKMEDEGLEPWGPQVLCVHEAEGLVPGASRPDAIKATKSDAVAARAGSGAW